MVKWQIGDVSITSVTEVRDAEIPGTAVLPTATPDEILAVDWLRPRFADDDGNIRHRMQALVVESRDRRIVIAEPVAGYVTATGDAYRFVADFSG